MELTPIDIKQCQAEQHNGANAFTLGGVPAYVRCNNAPIYIATETEPGKDGIIGSMSLCQKCTDAMISVLGEEYATLKIIN